MSVESQRCLANFQCKPSLWYKWEFSQSSNFSSWWRVWKNICIIFENKKGKSSLLTLLDRQMTGHIEHPKVQQQHRQPQNSQRTLTGRFFRKVTLTRVTVALNSSGATRACNPEGNSVSKRLDKPNLFAKKTWKLLSRKKSWKSQWFCTFLLFTTLIWRTKIVEFS